MKLLYRVTRKRHIQSFINMGMKYCVYLTTYRGNKLPPFYIGSSSVEKIASGYHGTVTSKEYAATWKAEIRNNAHLFKTQIVCIFETRKDALVAESRLQKTLKVVKNPLYTNKAIAAENGFFGYTFRKSYTHDLG